MFSFLMSSASSAGKLLRSIPYNASAFYSNNFILYNDDKPTLYLLYIYK